MGFSRLREFFLPPGSAYRQYPKGPEKTCDSSLPGTVGTNKAIFAEGIRTVARYPSANNIQLPPS